MLTKTITLALTGLVAAVAISSPAHAATSQVKLRNQATGTS